MPQTQDQEHQIRQQANPPELDELPRLLEEQQIPQARELLSKYVAYQFSQPNQELGYLDIAKLYVGIDTAIQEKYGEFLDETFAELVKLHKVEQKVDDMAALGTARKTLE